MRIHITIFCLSSEGAKTIISQLMLDGFALEPGLDKNSYISSNDNCIGVMFAAWVSHKLFQDEESLSKKIGDSIKASNVDYFGKCISYAGQCPKYISASNIKKDKQETGIYRTKAQQPA